MVICIWGRVGEALTEDTLKIQNLLDEPVVLAREVFGQSTLRHILGDTDNMPAFAVARRKCRRRQHHGYLDAIGPEQVQLDPIHIMP